jgi:hypothetical protein
MKKIIMIGGVAIFLFFGNVFFADKAQAFVPIVHSTFYVNTLGSNSCDGIENITYSASHVTCAFATIGKAISMANAGDTINVTAGNYIENIVINKALTISGPNANINPNTGIRVGEAVINGQINVYSGNVIIRGFTITNPSWNGSTIKGIFVHSASTLISNIIIQNNILTDIKNNSSFGAYGMMIQGAINTINVSANSIKNISSVGGWTSGVEVTPTMESIIVPQNVEIINNTFFNISNPKNSAQGFSVGSTSYNDSTIYGDPSQVIFRDNNLLGVKVRNLSPDILLDATYNDWNTGSSTVINGMVSRGVTYDPWNNSLDNTRNYDKAITSFKILDEGTVDESLKTITVNLPDGTAVTSLIPTIAINGLMVVPNSSIAQNFINPVIYTVIGEDGSMQSYTVNVVVASGKSLITQGSSGSGGGGSYYVYPCVSVNYSEWEDCINDVQYRNVLSKLPNYCFLTVSQQAARSRICGGNIMTGGQVLGVKIYPVGSLLRAPNKKIYAIVSTSTVKYISSLKELWIYRGHAIFNISYETLAQYKQVLGVKVYADGTLLRGPDHKIYVIINGKKQPIRSLKELMKYRGQKIIDVSAEVLTAY